MLTVMGVFKVPRVQQEMFFTPQIFKKYAYFLICLFLTERGLGNSVPVCDPPY